MQVCRGCLEFHGGALSWGLSRLMGGGGVAAMTLGHTILGQNPSMLRSARDHEHVHVKQYERWGPFFLIVYLGVSTVLWLRGRDCYRDNFFEIEAYAAHPLQPEEQQGADPDSDSTN